MTFIVIFLWLHQIIQLCEYEGQYVVYSLQSFVFFYSNPLILIQLPPFLGQYPLPLYFFISWARIKLLLERETWKSVKQSTRHQNNFLYNYV